MINDMVITEEEMRLVERIRKLRQFEKMEIKLLDNRLGKIIATITSTERLEMEI